MPRPVSIRSFVAKCQKAAEVVGRPLSAVVLPDGTRLEFASHADPALTKAPSPEDVVAQRLRDAEAKRKEKRQGGRVRTP